MTKSLVTTVVLVLALALATRASASPPQRPVVVVQVEGGGFHWVDAAIGAAATGGAGLAAVGIFVVFRKRTTIGGGFR